MAILAIEQLKVGDSYSEELRLDEEAVSRFVELTRDRAGIHVDRSFSAQRGFANLVTHGFLLSVPFSRILGMELPGEDTVIGSIELNFHAPVYQGDTVTYTATVKRILVPLGSVLLELKIEKSDGTLCVAGKTTCAFKDKRTS
jgi:3-hydroxybutyryl-CoA dehydratase